MKIATITTMLIMCVISQKSLAMAKAKNPSADEMFIEDDIASYYKKTMQYMDKIFDKQQKIMQATHKQMMQQLQSNHKPSQNMVKLQNNKPCEYQMHTNATDSINIEFEQNTLKIQGKGQRNGSTATFYYSVTVPKTCNGTPKVEHNKNKIDITFTINEKP